MRYFFLLIILLGGRMLSSQNFKKLLDTDVLFVDEVLTNNLTENQLFISMPFAKSNVLNAEQKKLVSERVVIKLELVYTKFRTVPTFDQKGLNRNRLKELKRLAPEVFENPMWEFSLVSQTKGNSRVECDPMFHGFVLTFRPNSSKDMLNQEVDYLNELVSQLTDTTLTDSIEKTFTIKTRWDDRIGYVHDTIWEDKVIEPIEPPDFFYQQSLYNDSTVLNIFQRQNDWKNFMVVTDVTGSMSPYIAQVFVWLDKQSQNRFASSFVFFNDGDDKKSSQKKAGKTGGIYTTKNLGVFEVAKKAALCMANGSGGGEGMENDVEAVLYGSSVFPDVSSVVLVADNYESMRDYSLIEKIKKPVHVILCGAEHRVNIQYLDLARKTKGSIHTITSDIYDLDKVQEGERITIDGNEYLYRKKRFNFVY